MKRSKKRLIEKIFNTISILFILGCFVFYGYRLVKYYKVFNPKKTELNGGLLSISVPKNNTIVTSGDGLYHIGGSYIYRGNVNNNYISFSGLMFRILKINYGSTVDLVLDSPITSLNWNDELTTYDKSQLHRYLNEEFIKYLNKDLLTTSSVCLDTINEISTNECKEQKSNIYVKSLDINTYLNTITDKTYINENDEYIWLSDRNDTMAWHTNGYNISTSFVDNFYGVLPVITLDMDVELIGGSGTIDDPYRIDAAKDYRIGSHVLLDKDTWRIIGTDDKTITLSLDGVLDKLLAFGNNVTYNDLDEGSLAYYLNNDYFNSLSYKDSIVTHDYKVNKSIVKTKISIPSIYDPKFGKSDNPYYLINNVDNENMYVYSDNVSTVKSTLAKSVKPVITISKSAIKSGNGTIEKPYTMKEN